MGNSQSNAASSAQAPRPPRSHASPRSRQSSLPAVDESPRQSSSGAPKATSDPRRRKKSIELSDVDTSLSFTHAQGKMVSGGGLGKKKLADRVGGEMLAGDDLVEEEGGGGTLRGAMQGKAEHVVYGPRRDDPATTTSSAGSTAPSTPHIRPTTIALPSAPITSMHDPDDTIHPGFKASPRLTSAVLMSQDKMPVLSSPAREEAPAASPFTPAAAAPPTSSPLPALSQIRPDTPTTSLSAAASAIFAPFDSASSSSADPTPKQPASPVPASSDTLLPPTTSPPYPTSSNPPTHTVLAPEIPADSLPISEADIPSGTSVLGSPLASPQPGASPSGAIPSPAVLLPPKLFNAPVAAIPIPLLSVPSATIAASLLAAAVDLGAGKDGVPTLIKWKNEDGQQRARDGKPATGPKEVFVTGTFAKGWKTKIELRRTE